MNGVHDDLPGVKNKYYLEGQWCSTTVAKIPTYLLTTKTCLSGRVSSHFALQCFGLAFQFRVSDRGKVGINRPEDTLCIDVGPICDLC
jgi:hypothetical protein